MNFIDIVIQAPIFAVLVLGYTAVLRSAATLVPLLTGIGIAVIRRKTEEPVSPQFLATLTRFEGVFGLLFLAAGTCAFFKWSLWASPWLMLWRHPLLLTCLYVVNVHQVGYMRSYNPILRQNARFSLLMVWPVLVTVLLGMLIPNVIYTATLKYALLLVVLLQAVFTCLALRSTPRDLGSFAEADRRHDVIISKLDRYQRIANVLGDSAQWVSITKTIQELHAQEEDAFRALRKKDFKRAVDILAHVEADLLAIQAKISNRIDLSLRDELFARLSQAEKDCSTLEQEAVQVGIASEALRQLRERVQSLVTPLGDTVFSESNLLEQIAPYEAVFNEIVATRTALRFRQNVSSVLDAADADLKRSRMHIDVSRVLGDDVATVQQLYDHVAEAVTSFRSKTVASSDELVEAYHALQRGLSLLKSKVNQLVSETKKTSQIRTLDVGRIYAFVPKRVRTRSPSSICLLITPQSPLRQVRCSARGVLLSLPTPADLPIIKSNNAEHAVGSLSFVGEKGGKGNLSLQFDEPAELKERLDFVVGIQPSWAESAKDAAILGTPAGGIAVLLIWYATSNVEVAAPLGAACGAVAAFLLFSIQRIRAASVR